MSSLDGLDVLVRAQPHSDTTSLSSNHGTYRKRSRSPTLLGSSCSQNKTAKAGPSDSGLPSVQLPALFQDTQTTGETTVMGKLAQIPDGKFPTTAINLHDDPLFNNYCPVSPRTEAEVEVMMSEELSDEKSFYADAFMFVEQAAAKVEEISPPELPDFVKLAQLDEIIEMTERLLEKQAEFLDAGKPGWVDIGIHYTRPENLPHIRTNGLLSKSERDERGIQSNYNGSAFGDGIYTGSNPGDHFGRYGTAGLVVLRLKGVEGTNRHGLDHDTTVSHRNPVARHIVVLKTSAQCAPIFQFDASMINRRDPSCLTHSVLKDLCDALQQLVDSAINKNCPDYVASKPESVVIHLIDPTFGVPPARLGTVCYNVSSRIDKEMLSRGMCKISLPFESGLECSVCREALGRDPRQVARVDECGHLIHERCLFNGVCGTTFYCTHCQKALNTSPCLGSMPNGSMQVSRDALVTCQGHAWGALTIRYVFPAGIQSAFHPSPGMLYESTTRTAYLPDTPDGRVLLSRLQESFRLGLTFKIGRSLSSGMSDVITWGSIPHKSALRGYGRCSRSSHGYPDKDYFGNCHAALDALHVRPASSGALLREDEAFPERNGV